MEIKVLGPGCSKCKTTYNVIEKFIKDNNINAELIKVDDIIEIMNYNILTTPAVVIDGEVKVKGYVPSEKELKQLLGL
ncbi:MAG: TM0996/MTH895 family glutaredoxin-like protein [Bacteroidales bacterium]|nr:TM0996/MTH895 family glutaredoxin-like protein [Bacteroidales bacterium]